jgi:thiol-disulfide isomerase/thioredoxin
MADTMPAPQGQKGPELQRQLPLGFFVLLAVVGVVAVLPAATKLFRHPKPPHVKGADLVYFYKPRCSACNSVTPLVGALHEARPDWRIVAVNAGEEQNRRLLSRYGQKYDLNKDDRGRVPALFFQKRRRSVVGDKRCFTELMSLLSAQAPQKPGPAKTGTKK